MIFGNKGCAPSVRIYFNMFPLDKIANMVNNENMNYTKYNSSIYVSIGGWGASTA